MLRRKRHAVDLVREERVPGEHLGQRDTPGVVLLLLALDAAVEPREEDVGCTLGDAGFFEQPRHGRPTPARGADRLEQPGLAHDVRLHVRASITGALHGHGRLDGRARAKLLERKRERALDEAVELQPPGRGIDVGNVVVRQQVVQADRRDVPAQRLERHAVVPRGELELFEADRVGHRRRR